MTNMHPEEFVIILLTANVSPVSIFTIGDFAWHIAVKSSFCSGSKMSYNWDFLQAV